MYFGCQSILVRALNSKTRTYAHRGTKQPEVSILHSIRRIFDVNSHVESTRATSIHSVVVQRSLYGLAYVDGKQRGLALGVLAVTHGLSFFG